MKCPLCSKEELYIKKVRNSLSRVDNQTYICNKCGGLEVLLQRPKEGRPRQCLFVQPELSLQIMLIVEDQAGYFPFGEPNDEQFALDYVNKANEKFNLNEEDIHQIVISSMAAL